jgi:hypothetical protein
MVGFGGLVMDIYWGLGVRALLVHEVAYAYYLSEEDDRLIWYNQNHQPVISDYTTFLPIINVGVKLGFGF